MFIVVYMTETDGDPAMYHAAGEKDLNEFVKNKRLYWMEFAVIKGHLVKGFNQQLDPEQLK